MQKLYFINNNIFFPREIYFFIKCQLEYLLYNETDDIYFINIFKFVTSISIKSSSNIIYLSLLL